MEDREIIALYHARNEEAIDQTAVKYGGYCHTIALRILRQEEEAEECVNDTYYRAWCAIPPHCPSCLRTFLGRIVRHLSFDRYRKNHAAKQNGGEMPLVLEELRECVHDDQRVETIVESHRITDILNDFLQSLSARDRRMFVRRYWYCDSLAQIAVSIGISENRAAVTLYRLRAKLKALLEKEGVWYE